MRDKLFNNVFCTVESVRSAVQPTWPDAETGVPLDEINRGCTVLTNYLDKGNFNYYNQKGFL